MPTLEFLSEFIHKCGGKIFLAHLYKYKLNNHIEYLDNIIEKNCSDTLLINTAEKHLVVANNVDNIAVINTDDATYISLKENIEDIKKQLLQDRDFISRIEKSMTETGDLNNLEVEPEDNENLDMDESKKSCCISR